MWLSRQVLALGEENTQKLRNSTVMVLGLGGVGAGAIEALARVGVENMILVDGDVFEETNLNRQLLATRDTLGLKKTEVAKKHLLLINENLNCEIKDIFYLPENKDELFTGKKIDYIIDAVDTLSAKLSLVTEAKKRNIPIFSSMGMGNRIDPSKIRVGDIFDTKGSGCGLSRVMRKELRRRGVKSLRVVYSEEIPTEAVILNENSSRHSPGSTALVPPVAGFFLASLVVKHIIEN